MEFEDYEFDQKISRNYLIMQAAAQREIEASESVGNFERSGSETPEPENQQLNCKLHFFKLFRYCLVIMAAAILALFMRFQCQII